MSSKVSEMIERFAAGYISMGETHEERQNQLNSACTAWNIAVLPAHARDGALRHVVEEADEYAAYAGAKYQAVDSRGEA